MSAIFSALLQHYLDIGHPVQVAARMAKEELAKREEIARKNRADAKSESVARGYKS